MRTDTATVIYCDPRTLEGDRPAPPLVAPFDVTDCISLAWDRVAAAVASMPPRTRKSPKRRAIIARAVRSLETEVSAAGSQDRPRLAPAPRTTPASPRLGPPRRGLAPFPARLVVHLVVCAILHNPRRFLTLSLLRPLGPPRMGFPSQG
jgi:hypothetical protein